MKKYSQREIAGLRKDALKYVLPNFAKNAELAKGPKIFVRGEGCYVYDITGKRYLDTFAAALTTICGHRRQEVAEAIKEQLEALEFFPNYVDTFTVPVVKLAKKLAEIMPGDLEVSFFVSSGSEANETALKMARQYHIERGERQRFKFIARRDSYHGTTLGGCAVTGLKYFREYFEPLMPGGLFVGAARDCDRPRGVSSRAYARQRLEEIENLIRHEGAESIAAMIMDPLPGSNTGYPLPPEGYLQGVQELCDKHGILLIFDEVQTGFGKTGKWFFCEHDKVVPDILTVGKGFGGGYTPLSAAVARRKVAEVFMEKPGSEFRSGGTFGGHTLACAATLANIGIIERDRLVAKAARTGKYLEKRLKEFYKYPIVGDVRGIGLLRVMELMADRRRKKRFDPKLGVGSFIRNYCWKRGMILRNNGDIMVYAPALIITREQVDWMLDLTERAIVAAAERFRL